MASISKLSICITTYNRKEQLIRLLKSIEKASFQKLYEVVICDNNSSYNIVECIESSISFELFEKCRFCVNSINIGAPGNIKNTFINCQSKYMWLMGDDDEILPDSIDIICNDIEDNPDCAFFKYSISSISKNGQKGHILESNCQIKDLKQFCDYYLKDKHNRGTLFFMSNNVLNLELLEPYIFTAVTYTTSITHMIPILMGLDDGKLICKYSSSKTCLYHQPVEGGSAWNYVRIFLAVSTITHIPFKSLDEAGLKRLMKVMTMTSFPVFCYWVVNNKDRVQSFSLVRILYNTYFVYTRHFYDALIYFLTYLEYRYGLKTWSSFYDRLLPFYKKNFK